MSRFISPNASLVLLYDTGNVTPPVDDPQPKAAYNFYYGELIVGDPYTVTGTANTVTYADLMEVFPNESGAAAKSGLGTTYFEAPYLLNTATLTVGKTYKVILGSATYNGSTYTEHQTFVCVSGHTSFTGTGTIALELDAQYRNVNELNHRNEAYIQHNLTSAKDEASWNDQTMQQDLPDDPYSWVRS